MIIVNGKEVLFEKFPNGETRLVADSLPDDGISIRTVSFKYEDDSDLIKLMFVKSYIDSRHSPNYIPLVIYYMPYSRMDRSENDSPFTLKYVASFINSLQFKKVYLIEPHSDVTPALINNSVSVYINYKLLPVVMEEVGFNSDEDYIMYPDAGASKRYSKMSFKNTVVGNKNRDFETGKITDMSLSISGKGSGNKVIIVDDLSSYGGTFVMSAEALREAGFDEIYLLVAHAENSIFKGVLFDNITKIFTTDSIVSEQDNDENLKFKEQLKIYDLKGVLSND